ncbi:MAG: MFS transporter [Methanobrevibacter sp.]|jgi:EmrB/QacA subfamily drug resistance transporter|nr:MFS transporter [Candidatus Methanoflexus mossambicus]
MSNLGNTKNKGSSKWMPAIVVCIAVFIIVLDMSAMNVAISELVTDLDTKLTTIQTIIALYSLIIASFMLIGSKLQDVIGRKKSFLAGSIIYGVGTLIASTSVDWEILLIGWAIFEGIGAALMLPATTTIIGTSYEGKDKLTAFGIWGGIGAMGSAIGPIFGGFFTTYLSWRMIFGSEFIIVILILLFSKYISNSKSTIKFKEFDYFGAVLSVISLVIFVLGMLQINTPANWSFAIALIVVGIILFICFIAWELRLIKNNKKPLTDVRLLKNKVFSMGIVNAILQQIPLAGFMFIMPVFLQQVIGLNAFMTGVILLPSSIAIMLLSLVGAKISQYIPPKQMLTIGFIISAIGTYLLSGGFSLNTNIWDIIPATIIFGVGIGLVLSQLTNYIMSAIDESKSSDGAGLLNTFKNLGYSVGTAMIGVLLVVSVFGGLSVAIEDSNFGHDMSKDEIHTNIFNYFEKMQTGANPDLPDEVKAEAPDIINNTINIAMKWIFTILSAIFVIAAVFSYFTPKPNRT